jgi:hypothetical protein
MSLNARKNNLCLGVTIIILTLISFPPFRNVKAETASSTVHNRELVKKQVSQFFSDIPVMIEIARCESNFRQFADSGNVFKGGTNKKMIGIFQIYDDVHREMAKSLNMDIDTVEGNMAYALHLYEREKTNPWIDSMSCWNTKPVNEGNGQEATPLPITTNLNFGMIHPQVLTLQQILNKNGYTIASDGPGSIGNETTKFGLLTRVAVRNFQCEKRIVCNGDEYTTAYGVVGPRTREALLALASMGSSPQTDSSPSPALTKEERNAQIRSQIELLKKQITDLELKLE